MPIIVIGDTTEVDPTRRRRVPNRYSEEHYRRLVIYTIVDVIVDDDADAYMQPEVPTVD